MGAALLWTVRQADAQRAAEVAEATTELLDEASPEPEVEARKGRRA